MAVDMTTSGTLQFGQQTIETIVEKTVSLDLIVDSSDEPVAAVDIWISYDPQSLEFILPVKNHGILPVIESRIIAPGKLYISAIHPQPASATSIHTSIAKIFFTSKKTGVSNVSFLCDGADKFTSQIVSASSQNPNIIDCAKTNKNHITMQIKPEDVSTQVKGVSDTRQLASNTSINTILFGVVLIAVALVLYLRKAQKTQPNPFEDSNT